MTIEKKKNWIAIVVMFFLFAMISFVTNLAAPVGTIWTKKFEDSNFIGMLGNLMNFAAYLFMGIPAGKILSRKGYKFTALLAVGIGLVGVFIQFLVSQTPETTFLFGLPCNFFVYLLGAFVCGFSVCMLNTVVNPMLNTLGGGGKTGGQMLQYGGALNSLAATITPMMVGALIGTLTKETPFSSVNPVLFIAMGVFAFAFLVLWIAKIPEPHIQPKVAAVKSRYSAWSFRHFVMGAVGIFIYVGVEVGVPGTMTYYLSGKTAAGGVGLSMTIAGFLAGLYWLMMLFGRLLGGLIGGKVSSKTLLGFASSIAIVLILIAMFIEGTFSIPSWISSNPEIVGAQVPLKVIFFILVGLCTSVMWGGIFNLAVEGLGKFVTTASGIFMMMVVGGGIIPLLQNGIADWTGGNFMISYLLPIAGLAYLLFYALVGCKNVNKDIPVE